MEEYKFNSENNFSNPGERSTSSPVTIHFKEPDFNQKSKEKKKSSSGKVLATVCTLVCMLCVSVFSGILTSNFIVNRRLDAFVNTYTDTLVETESTAVPVPDGGVSIHISEETTTPVDTASTSQEATSPLFPNKTASYAAVANAVKDSVVEISTEMATGNSFFQQFVQSGAGSGVIISKDGYIITNNHVIEGATRISVRLTNGAEYEAKLIGTDDQADIAVLKIEATDLTFAVIGSSKDLVVGEEVLAIGNPLGELGGSVTNGIISALDREMTIEGQTMRLLQTNAAINPGNSGGGLFNMDGELVAIVNAKSSGLGIEGLGFAIPIDYAYSIASELLTNGYVSGRPAMGISYIEISTYWDLLSYGVPTYGIYVYDGGETGLENGDRIVSIGEHEIQYSASLKKAVQSYKVGDTIEVTVARNGRFIKVNVTLIESKPEANTLEESTLQ